MNRKTTVVATLVSSLACIAILQTASAGQKPADPPPAAPPQEERTDGIYDALGLVERDASLVTIAQGFGFTEGPAVDSKGNVYFTDQPNDRIHRWDAKTGSVTLWLQGSGRANGMIFDRDDNLIAAADMHGELWKIFADGSHRVLIDDHQGKLLNGPNDVWLSSGIAIDHYDGQTFTRHAIPSACLPGDFSLYVSGNTAYFVNERAFGRILTMDGDAEVEVLASLPCDSKTLFRGISGTSATEVFVTMENRDFIDYACGTTFMGYFDGTVMHRL